MIGRALLAALAIGILISCSSSHAPSVIIDREGRGDTEYAAEEGSHIARLRCNNPENDATCERVALRGCQQLGARRANHLGSHRVEWPPYANGPFPARPDSDDWMWVVVCEES